MSLRGGGGGAFSFRCRYRCSGSHFGELQPVRLRAFAKGKCVGAEQHGLNAAGEDDTTVTRCCDTPERRIRHFHNEFRRCLTAAAVLIESIVGDSKTPVTPPQHTAHTMVHAKQSANALCSDIDQPY